jgi:3-oxoacyl-[acyl-carrier protein] reductase
MLGERRVFITGVTRGIGKAIAKTFKAKGAYVIGTGTSTAAETEFYDQYVKADFEDEAQILKCSDIIRDLAPDILINNAGINKIGSFAEISPRDFLLIQRVNLFAPFCFCQAAIPAMINKSWGRIVNISSVWGVISKEFRASYSASKFALDGMTVALSHEYSGMGILANCVSPGFTDTELTRNTLSQTQLNHLIGAVPIGRLATTDEIAHIVAWLCGPENTYLTGQNIAVDGGFSRA